VGNAEIRALVALQVAAVQIVPALLGIRPEESPYCPPHNPESISRSKVPVVRSDTQDAQSCGAGQLGLIPVEGAKIVGGKRQGGSHVEGVRGVATQAVRNKVWEYKLYRSPSWHFPASSFLLRHS
jgi:hypothetical protein